MFLFSMPRKKSVKKSARDFRTATSGVAAFLETVSVGQSDAHISLLHNYAIIKLYRDFEGMILDSLVGAINNDLTTVSSVAGVSFPKHLSDEVCEYLIIGTGYFDFKGRSGLISKLKTFVPPTHYLITIVKKKQYQEPLERLAALRNYAAHESGKSKKAALDAVGQKRISSAGAIGI